MEQLSNSVVAFAPDGRAKVQEIIEEVNTLSANAAGDSTAFADQMVAWLGTLPTADPGDGKPWLNSGVLTVGAAA